MRFAVAVAVCLVACLEQAQAQPVWHNQHTVAEAERAAITTYVIALRKTLMGRLANDNMTGMGRVRISVRISRSGAISTFLIRSADNELVEKRVRAAVLKASLPPVPTSLPAPFLAGIPFVLK